MFIKIGNKVANFQACNFIEKRLQHRCFFCEISKIFKNTFFHGLPPVAASVFGTLNKNSYRPANTKSLYYLLLNRKSSIENRKKIPAYRLLVQLVSIRSSRSQMLFKISALKNFAIFTGK